MKTGMNLLLWTTHVTEEHFPLIEAGSEHLPFRDASFDMITIGFALRHFADLDSVFRDCRRVHPVNCSRVVRRVQSTPLEPAYPAGPA